MRFSFSVLIFAFLGILTTTAAVPTNRHVLLVSIDGLPADMLKDPAAPLRTIRRLAAEGTVAEGMRVSNPSITWPNHTTLVTGVEPAQHRVIYNGVLTRSGAGVPVRVDPKKTKTELIAVPTLFDHLHSLGLTIGDVNWPSTRAAATLHWSFPDVPEQVTHMTPSLRQELIEAGILKDAADASFLSLSGAAKDQVWTATACHLIEKHRPNLLLVHLLITDTVHHRYGARSTAGHAAVALADAHVNEMLSALERAGILQQTTLIITSDHGFAHVTNILHPNVLFRKAGLLETESSGALRSARVQSVSAGGTAIVYFTDPATKQQDRTQALELLRSQREIALILEPHQFAHYGYPDPAQFPGMGELVLVPKDGFGFSNASSGEAFVTPVPPEGNVGYHGYLSTNPKMDAAFVAWGRGVKKGHKLGIIRNTQVAPTIARLFETELPGASGEVIIDLLQP